MLYTTASTLATWCRRLSIGILKIQFACYTQPAVSKLDIEVIVYWDFKDTICMLYTTVVLPHVGQGALSIGILKIQFAC